MVQLYVLRIRRTRLPVPIRTIPKTNGPLEMVEVVRGSEHTVPPVVHLFQTLLFTHRRVSTGATSTRPVVTTTIVALCSHRIERSGGRPFQRPIHYQTTLHVTIVHDRRSHLYRSGIGAHRGVQVETLSHTRRTNRESTSLRVLLLVVVVVVVTVLGKHGWVRGIRHEQERVGRRIQNDDSAPQGGWRVPRRPTDRANCRGGPLA